MEKPRNKSSSRTKRALIGLVGWAFLLLGVVMIPYPGPGWVVVFIGLSILATEFDWAKDVHDFMHGKYDEWQKWIARQPFYVRAIFWVLTCLTVVITVWLINGYGLLNSWLHLGFDWLESPFIPH
jgi:uncharacterized protein (TIGR02611 family)